jgi:biopolymer transport protein ExbD
MNHLLEVCAISIALLASFVPVANAQTLERAETPMYRGISVELPVSTHSIPMPDADQEDATVVVIDQTGSVFLGVQPITPAALAQRLKGNGSPVYIKADARTVSASVQPVLDALRAAGVHTSTLLTTKQTNLEPGTIVPPEGLTVSIDQAASASSLARLQVLESRQQWSSVTVNDEQVPWALLESKLRQLLQNRNENVISVTSAPEVQFGRLLRVIDVCRAANAEVSLVTPKP